MEIFNPKEATQNIKQEKLIKEHQISVSSGSKKKILFQMKDCICKIYLKNDEIGIGFYANFLSIIIPYQF